MAESSGEEVTGSPPPVEEGPAKAAFVGLGLILAGFWLVLLYIAFVSLVVLSLGAYQLQYSIRGFRVDDDKLLPLWAVSQIYSNWTKAESLVTHLESQLWDARSDLEAQTKKLLKMSSDNTIKDDETAKQQQLVDQKQEKVDLLETRLKLANQELVKLLIFDEVKLDPSVGDFITAMKFFKHIDQDGKTLDWVLPDFTAFPPDILTLILVLSMGALGGTIHLTRLYFDHKTDRDQTRLGIVKTTSYYVFRPFLGAITALSVYILAKAGVLIVSTPADDGSGVGLSPFFVSFLGIISGLLAEQALDTIQTAGRNWFSATPQVGADRWADRVKAILTAEDKPALANALGVSTEVLDSWIDEKSAVPARAQSIIAAWLRKPPRELFTDLAPATRE